MDDIDFETYRYFDARGIVRANRLTKECERFIGGRFVKSTENVDALENATHDGFSDIHEFENSPRALDFLKRELKR